MLRIIDKGPWIKVVVNKDGFPMGPVFNFDISGEWFMTWDGESGISEYYLKFLYEEIKKMNDPIFEKLRNNDTEINEEPAW